MSQIDSRTPSDDNVTVLSRKTEIRGGTLSVAHDLTVRGVVEGEVRVGGKVVVAPGAQVLGLLEAREATIAGRVQGDLSVSETLTLRSTAVVDGTATANRLVVEEGSSGSVSLKVGGREFFDVLETRRREARVELERVRSKMLGPSDRTSPDGPGGARTAKSPISTEKLIESREMKDFLASESADVLPRERTVPDASGASDDAG